MTKKMLIDATHPEETRVAVVEGSRLLDFDYESKVRKQLKGSIFLAKVTRVEPSLQAAFVNFGGNRHGFLPFSEIHPDYFRIPIADREALIAEQEAEMEALRAAEEAEEAEAGEGEEAGESFDEDVEEDEVESLGGEDEVVSEEEDQEAETSEESPDGDAREEGGEDADDMEGPEDAEEEAEDEEEAGEIAAEEPGALPDGEEAFDEDSIGNRIPDDAAADIDGNVRSRDGGRDDGDRDGDDRGGRRGRRGRGGRFRGGRGRFRGGRGGGQHNNMAARSRRVEIIGGDGIEGDHPRRPSLRRNYKIQEVIKRGQIMLIQVSKEERGNKGAAVTTYLSLPGRYCVLMPNSPRAGGVSRKIANFKERRRMREILAEFSIPQGMSVIMRTAGVERTKPEIKRDLDYLMRLWDNIRELTLQSTAPALINEEGNLIKRSIRDIYGQDVEEILVSGDDGFKLAKDFMKMLIPSHAKNVKQYKEEEAPLFHRYGVESQIAETAEPSVALPSGGYIVINPTEALVSIDVNSGRATKERHIEETAYITNMEAAAEVARQLRLRDLGGLIVIDFIDMEDRRNNFKVERKLKEALSVDRARIQVGRISSFGLLELSRQRLNPSLTEAQFEKCSHCQGTGYVRTVDAAAITALRALEEEGVRGRTGDIVLQLSNEVALYILNNKRDMLNDLERRYGFRILIRTNEEIGPAGYMFDSQTGGGQGGGQGAGRADDGGAGFRGGERERGRGGRGGRGRGRGRGGRWGGNGEQRPFDAPDEGEDEGRETAPVGDADGGESFGEAGNGDAFSDEAGGAEERSGGAYRGEDRDGGDDRGRRGRRRRRGGRGRGRRGGGRDGESREYSSPGDDGGAESGAFESGDGEEPGGRDEGGQTPPPSRSRESIEIVTAAKVAESASNDVHVPRDYEKVNEPPEKKKKGWWNKLTS